jgi:hypothetical protein
MEYAVFKSNRPVSNGEIRDGIRVTSGQYTVRGDKLAEFFAMPCIRRAIKRGDIVQLDGGSSGGPDTDTDTAEIQAGLTPVPEIHLPAPEPAPESYIGIREARRIARLEFHVSAERLDQIADTQPAWKDEQGAWQIPVNDLRELLEKPEPEQPAEAEEA